MGDKRQRKRRKLVDKIYWKAAGVFSNVYFVNSVDSISSLR